jgi:Protein of unknown function (DUF732)
MSDETTVVDATEALDPPETGAIYAWSAEDDFTVPANHVDQPVSGGRVLAVAVVAAVAAVAAVTAGVVVLLTPAPQPQRQYVIRPAPVEQLPPPPAPKPAPPPVVAAPPVQHVQAPPPDANQRFSALLGQGQMWQNTPDDNQQAISLCQDLAHGGSVQPYIDGTLRKSPQLTPQEARQVVEDAIRAYCPQYG